MPLKPLDEIFEEMEELGLAADAKPEASGGTEDRRLRHTLAEVNAFIDQHGRLPGEKGADGVSPSLSEWDLASKLKGLREKAHCDIEIHDLIVPADRHGILETAAEAPAPPESLDEIFDSGHPLLSGPAEDIFVLRHVPPKPARSDAISERSVCRDFEEFRPLFDECIAELSDGTRRVRRFTNEQEINAGDFFILGGTLLYVAEVGEGHRRGGKRNARLRLIFDNGTEGRNLLRSLAAELYKDLNGRRVTDPNAGPLFDDTVDEGDSQTGMIYVVESLSDDPAIRDRAGRLYKIGFTAGKMELRIQGAEQDPTFLMAPVKPVTTYTLYNIDKAKLEHLLHRFFAAARLDIEITDRFGQKIRPREWFAVPFPAIEEAIERLQDGTITDYLYDAKSGRIRRRD